MKRSLRGDVTLERIGEDLVFTWPAYRLTATVSRLRQRGDGLTGELLLTHEIAGRIHWGQLSLASISARKTLADKLKRDVGPEGNAVPNWTALLDNLCYMAAQEFREDGAFVHVGALDDAADRDEYLIPPLLLAGEFNLIYGSPGTGKGYLYAGLMLHAAGLPVLPLPASQTPARPAVLDWEWSARELNQRLRAICRGAGVPDHVVAYRRMHGPLADAADRLRVEIHRQGTTLLIIDSLQMACGPNDGGDPSEAFLRLAAAVRSFGVTTLFIDHPAKGAERGAETPYGTRYKLALIRNIWVARKCFDDQQTLHVGLWHDQNSNVPHHPPLGFRLLFTRDSWPAGKLRALTFAAEDVRAVEGFSDLLTDLEKLERLLAAEGPLDTKACAVGIGKSADAVRVRLNEGRSKGRIVKLPDGRWALAARRADE